MCLRVLLDVFSSFQSQVLGGTFIAAYGEASGFFVFWRCLVRRIANPPKATQMLLFDSSSTLHSLSSGRQYFRRGSICLYQGGTLTQQLSHSLIRNASSRSDFRFAGSINTYHADMGISVPVPAFFVSRNTSPFACFSIY